MSWTDADTQFYLILAATAAAIALVVLVYSRISHRRSRAAVARREAVGPTAEAGAPAPEPVFFKRYVIDERSEEAPPPRS